RPSLSRNPLACSVAGSAFQRSQTSWFVGRALADPSSPRAVSRLERGISAPLPRCESTSATVHFSAPLWAASWSSVSPSTTARRRSWLARSSAMVSSTSEVMTGVTGPRPVCSLASVPVGGRGHQCREEGLVAAHLRVPLHPDAEPVARCLHRLDDLVRRPRGGHEPRVLSYRLVVVALRSPRLPLRRRPPGPPQ